MTSVSTIPVSSTLQSLDLEPGDALFVVDRELDMVTVSIDRHASGRPSAPSIGEFLDQWTGRFSIPEAEGDERLAHILAKHVK